MKYLFLLILPCLQVKGQSVDSIVSKMDKYGFDMTTDQLFIHTDKHIYTNNEWIWFSAYLLNTKVDSLSAHRLMSIALVQAGTQQVVVQKKFVMSDGLSQGSINLPDSIAPGEYSLLGYTNIMGNDSLPLALFTQDLSIRTIHQSQFEASMKIEKDSLVSISVTDKSMATPIRNAELMVWIGDKLTEGKTGKNGVYSITIPGKQSGLTINVRIKYNEEFTYLQTQLPQAKEKRKLGLSFYPESGNLVAKATCAIGWESKTEQGEPIAVVGVLHKNDQPIDTIFTDEMGLGRFMLSPDHNAIYDVRVYQLPEGVQGKNKYPLPAVNTIGISMHVPKALANDSLFLNIYAPGHKWIKMVVHNFKNIFAEQVFKGRPGAIKALLLTSAYPRGLTAITLFDSENNPVAERIFFAHYTDQIKLKITSNKNTYKTREKVTLHFELSGSDQIADIASVACAQANRFDRSKQRDINSFIFLEHELEKLPVYTKDWEFNDTTYLEKTLLVRSWRKYNWQDMIAHPIGKPAFYSPSLRGIVQGVSGKIKKPVDVTLVGGANLYRTFTSDERGNFNLHYDDVIINQDERFLLYAKRNDVLQGQVIVVDPFTQINKKLALQIRNSVINVGKFLKHSRDLALSDFNKINYLPEFIAKAKSNIDNSIYGYDRSVNKCGDYVCQYNILNCPNHPYGGVAPEKGKRYYLPDRVGEILYRGCMLEESETGFSVYDGIKIGKQFYGEDFSTRTDEVPEFISTIYWSPELVFDASGKAECSFYTSDITGLFRVVVNGIAGDQLFSATTTIDVK